jgi:large subunit ribosomal protein L29
MKYKEIASKTEVELHKELEKVREELCSTKVKVRLSEAKTTHTINQLRKDVARILTALNKK